MAGYHCQVGRLSHGSHFLHKSSSITLHFIDHRADHIALLGDESLRDGNQTLFILQVQVNWSGILLFVELIQRALKGVLRKRRKAAGYTQQVVAQALSYTRTRIIDIDVVSFS